MLFKSRKLLIVIFLINFILTKKYIKTTFLLLLMSKTSSKMSKTTLAYTSN
jgi:hypothetical protein